MVALKFHSFVFVGRHWNMVKEFWKFIEFEGSGRPRAGDGMIEAFRLLSSARAQMLSELRVVTKKQTAQCCLAQASAGADRLSETERLSALAPAQALESRQQLARNV